MDHKTMAYILLGIWQAQAPNEESKAICDTIFNEKVSEIGLTEGPTWESVFKEMVHALEETVNWHSAPWLWQPELDAEEKVFKDDDNPTVDELNQAIERRRLAEEKDIPRHVEDMMDSLSRGETL
jgi:hypothetical protein